MNAKNIAMGVKRVRLNTARRVNSGTGRLIINENPPHLNASTYQLINASTVAGRVHNFFSFPYGCDIISSQG
jgi:hypothetical protein